MRWNKGALPARAQTAASLGTGPAVLGDSFIKGEKHPRSISLNCPGVNASPQALLSHTGQNKQMLQPREVKY